MPELADSSGLRAILSGNTEETMKHIKLDPQNAQKTYEHLRGYFFQVVIGSLWNQAKTDGRFTNQYGYVKAAVTKETESGNFTLSLIGRADGLPSKPNGNWSVADVQPKDQPDGLIYNLRLTYPNGYRTEEIGITKDNQIVFTGSKSTILLDKPEKLNTETSMGHYTPVSMLATIAEYDLIKPLKELISGGLN